MTKIEWTERTWNPVTGCDRTSPGCDNCYALTMAGRLKAMGQPKYQVDGDPRTSGPGFGVTCHPDELDRPAKWRNPSTVFVNSMSDLFHKDVPLDFILDVWRAMARCPQHTFQVLTKRPRRAQKILSHLNWAYETNEGEPTQPYLLASFDDFAERCELGEHDGCCEDELLNVWLGTSIESDRYTFRADHLRETPAAVRFVSLEPLLGPLPSLDLTNIDWAIVGCESGKGTRPMDLGWARDIRDQCADTGTKLFVKQLHLPGSGLKAVKELDLFPEDLRVRDMPPTREVIR